MLEVQKYLLTHKVEDLEEELSIEITRHNTRPLFILNYHQVDSPKKHPIVRECRGLVLEEGTNKIVAKGFDRFYNWGEWPEQDKEFKWDTATIQEKIDGSLILLYHSYGKWRINTRRTFGDKEFYGTGATWADTILSFLNKGFFKKEKLWEDFTYVFEFVHPLSQVVRYYHEPDLYLLSIFNRKNCQELDKEVVDAVANSLRAKRPKEISIRCVNELREKIRTISQNDPTFEGVVARDEDGRRVKLKSEKYVMLAHLKGNGEIFRSKNLVPLILDGEVDEVIAYFPEQASLINEAKEKLEDTYEALERFYQLVKDIEDQKEFASSVSIHPLKSILFLSRSKQIHLREAFNRSKKVLTNFLF